LTDRAEVFEQLPGLGAGGQQALHVRLLVGRQFAVQVRTEKFRVRQVLHGSSGSGQTIRR